MGKIGLEHLARIMADYQRREAGLDRVTALSLRAMRHGWHLQRSGESGALLGRLCGGGRYVTILVPWSGPVQVAAISKEAKCV